MKFSELPIIPPLQKALERLEFTKATEIQEKVIPAAIHHHDILGTAQTGSWKTLAFVLPILQNLYNKRLEKNLPDGKIKRNIQALILAPTRELAVQIGETLAPYCTNTNMKHTVIFGWVNTFHQIKAIEKGVDILVATPGRLEDLISQGVVKLSYVDILTIDEADRMIEMWAIWDIKKVLKRLPEEKQTLFFSATMPKDIQEIADSLMKTPRKISVAPPATPTKTITQKVFHLNRNYKRQLLQQIIKTPGLKTILVFANTIDETEKVYEFVKAARVSCAVINKKKSQNQRQAALTKLKKKEIKVLVATDLASRGLDVNDLSCVINYEVPTDSETYVHRIGRTARAGKDGLAVTFCTTPEKDRFAAIEKLIGQKVIVDTDDSYKSVVVPQWQSERLKKINEKTKKPTRGKRQYWKNAIGSKEHSQMKKEERRSKVSSKGKKKPSQAANKKTAPKKSISPNTPKASRTFGNSRTVPKRGRK